MGRDLRKLSEAEMRAVRGKQITMILQDPKFSLNPVMRAGDQILEALSIHGKIGRREGRKRGHRDPEGRAHPRSRARLQRLYP